MLNFIIMHTSLKPGNTRVISILFEKKNVFNIMYFVLVISSIHDWEWQSMFLCNNQIIMLTAVYNEYHVVIWVDQITRLL